MIISGITAASNACSSVASFNMPISASTPSALTPSGDENSVATLSGLNVAWKRSYTAAESWPRPICDETKPPMLLPPTLSTV